MNRVRDNRDLITKCNRFKISVTGRQAILHIFNVFEMMLHLHIIIYSRYQYRAVTMAITPVLYYLLIFIIHSSTPSFVFHENTNIMFTPANLGISNEYFGFSTLLTPDG